MNENTNIVRNANFAMDAQKLKRCESNLRKANVMNFLRKLGMNSSQRGTFFMADIICFCIENNIYSIPNFKNFSEGFADFYYNFNAHKAQRMIWNIEDSIEWLEKSPTRNDELLCSFLFEFKFDKSTSAKQFLINFLLYISAKNDIFDNN